MHYVDRSISDDYFIVSIIIDALILTLCRKSVKQQQNQTNKHLNGKKTGHNNNNFDVMCCSHEENKQAHHCNAAAV